KLGVLAEAERRVDSGEFHYSDPVTIEPEDVTEDGSFEDSGVSLTLDEALEAMITISDNGAALALWHILGGSNIDATLTKAGMPDFHVAFDDSEDNVATPHAIARYQVTRTPVSVDTGEVHRISFPITNIGSRSWTPGGAGSVGLIWELRNSTGQLLNNAARPVTLPALAPNETQNVSVDVLVPQQPGTYTVTLGLT